METPDIACSAWGSLGRHRERRPEEVSCQVLSTKFSRTGAGTREWRVSLLEHCQAPSADGSSSDRAFPRGRRPRERHLSGAVPRFVRVWGRSSVGRAPALQAGRQGFETPRLHGRSDRGSGEPRDVCGFTTAHTSENRRRKPGGKVACAPGGSSPPPTAWKCGFESRPLWKRRGGVIGSTPGVAVPGVPRPGPISGL